MAFVIVSKVCVYGLYRKRNTNSYPPTPPKCRQIVICNLATKTLISYRWEGKPLPQPLKTQKHTHTHTHTHTHKFFPCKHNINGKLIKISSIGKRWGTKLLKRVMIAIFLKKSVKSTNFSKIPMLEKISPNFVYHKMGKMKRKRREKKKKKP